MVNSEKLKCKMCAINYLKHLSKISRNSYKMEFNYITFLALTVIIWNIFCLKIHLCCKTWNSMLWLQENLFRILKWFHQQLLCEGAFNFLFKNFCNVRIWHFFITWKEQFIMNFLIDQILVLKFKTNNVCLLRIQYYII